MDIRSAGLAGIVAELGGDMAATVAGLSIACATQQRDAARSARDFAREQRESAFRDRVEAMHASALCGLAGSLASSAGGFVGGVHTSAGAGGAAARASAVGQGCGAVAELGQSLLGTEEADAALRQDVAEEAIDDARDVMKDAQQQIGRAFDAADSLRRSVQEGMQAALRA